MTRERKTVDLYDFYVNYGDGWGKVCDMCRYKWFWLGLFLGLVVATSFLWESVATVTISLIVMLGVLAVLLQPFLQIADGIALMRAEARWRKQKEQEKETQ